ncbi:MAG: MBL fold metallo-hydrolase [Nanoarchaeota archaeon]
MITSIKPNIYQLHFRNFGSCVYVLKINSKVILIDTSSKSAKEELLNDLKTLKISPENVDVVILTHNHYDHIENLNLFKNTKTYLAEELNKNSIIKELPKMKIIETPGHTPESKCFLYQDILFSGDTIFHQGGIGRMDLPGGSEEQMRESLKKLKKIKFKILCPGHI